MKVILTNKVKSLGNIGEIVNVSQGFARNYLIPNKMAKLADEGNSDELGPESEYIDEGDNVQRIRRG